MMIANLSVAHRIAPGQRYSQMAPLDRAVHERGDGARSSLVPRAMTCLLLLVAGCSPTPRAASPVTPTPPSVPAPSPAPAALASLAEGQRTQGFVARALYVDDDGRPRGARFVHERTRFVFDYLAIESAPAGVRLRDDVPDLGRRRAAHAGAPAPRQGEQGPLARQLRPRDARRLERVHRAVPHRLPLPHRRPGRSAFWGILRTQLDALLHPDYSDEEIRREVRNFGVGKRPDGTLALDEKGTVYNEMVRTYESPSTPRVGRARAAGLRRRPPARPVAAAARRRGSASSRPKRSAAFTTPHYQLANMGMVGAFPSSVPLADVLAQSRRDARRARARSTDARRYMTEADLPPAHGAPPGDAARRRLPLRDVRPAEPRDARAGRRRARLDIAERTAMEVFLGAFAGGEGSTLYEALVDRKTRVARRGRDRRLGVHERRSRAARVPRSRERQRDARGRGVARRDPRSRPRAAPRHRRAARRLARARGVRRAGEGAHHRGPPAPRQGARHAAAVRRARHERLLDPPPDGPRPRGRASASRSRRRTPSTTRCRSRRRARTRGASASRPGGCSRRPTA